MSYPILRNVSLYDVCFGDVFCDVIFLEVIFGWEEGGKYSLVGPNSEEILMLSW